MEDAVTLNEQVTAYQSHVEFLARKYVGFGNAELDDLVQEGLIAVWQTLSRGLTPSMTVVENRMLDWVRFLNRLQRNDAIAYERILPIEEYDHAVLG
jgi:DNA-directed RNA polymerase specialized sigma24 family protein